MKKRFCLNMHDYIHQPDSKLVFNRQLFSYIASKYDFVNRILSFGRDSAWKDRLVNELPDVKTPECLDIACGTGDITFRLAARYPQSRIIGIDITGQMLDLARSRATSHGARVTFELGDMRRLNFPDDSFDIITAGYALRNAPDLEIALKEIHRVMRPGATAAILDLSKSSNWLCQKIEFLLLKIWCGFCGLIFHRNPQLYTYIAESLKQFPDRISLEKLLTSHGFEIVASRKHFLGFTEINFFSKPY